MVDFWIQIHNLPEAYRSENNIAMVSRMFHKIIEIDRAALQSQIYRKFVRVFVQVDTSKPIPDGFYIRHQQKRTWIEFKYEKLYSLCYHCGGIEHTRLECDLRRISEENGDQPPMVQRWGPWTRASSPLFSPRTIQQQEVEAVVVTDAASTSESPGGSRVQSPANTMNRAIFAQPQMVPQSLVTTPAIHQSPHSSFAQNFPLSPSVNPFQYPYLSSPSPQSYPRLYPEL
ncbi:unnamed protein product [Linum trigynum]|uniref:Zinc knuckle CX2CX4HX4C domain-containing protein n=1 Tax=Linum trigynum TaxID=586398 RepID=A0AAV2GSR2_9ROSI